MPHLHLSAGGFIPGRRGGACCDWGAMHVSQSSCWKPWLWHRYHSLCLLPPFALKSHHISDSRLILRLSRWQDRSINYIKTTTNFNKTPTTKIQKILNHTFKYTFLYTHKNTHTHVFVSMHKVIFTWSVSHICKYLSLFLSFHLKQHTSHDSCSLQQYAVTAFSSWTYLSKSWDSSVMTWYPVTIY